jgi:hypothetical protein
MLEKIKKELKIVEEIVKTLDKENKDIVVEQTSFIGKSKFTKYIKIPINKEVKIKRLYIWLNEQIDNDISYREIDFGEWQEEDIYTNKAVVVANWNNLPAALPDYINRLNIDIAYSDECLYCECGKYMNLAPGSYGWVSNFIRTDSDIICRKCIENDPSLITDNEFQDNYFINNDDVALPFWTVNLIEKDGFVRYEEDYESGWHDGQTDTPESIIQDIEDIDKYERLWVIDGKGQFDIDFSLYLRKIEE